MSEIKELTEKLHQFRVDRDWVQFHKPKDIALSMTLEAAEVLEHFQWKTDEEIQEYVRSNKDDLAEELADVFNWVLLMSRDIGINIIEASHKKIEQNNKKYPVEKAKGNKKKYTEL